MKRGRPTKLNKKVIDACWEYLENCKDKPIVDDKQKFLYLEVNLPKAAGLLIYLWEKYGIYLNQSTLYAWGDISDTAMENKTPLEQKHKIEFSKILTVMNSLQEHRVIDNALTGTYNALLSKLLLGKHGYKEESRQEQTIDPKVKELLEKANKILP